METNCRTELGWKLKRTHIYRDSPNRLRFLLVVLYQTSSSLTGIESSWSWFSWLGPLPQVTVRTVQLCKLESHVLLQCSNFQPHYWSSEEKHAIKSHACRLQTCIQVGDNRYFFLARVRCLSAGLGSWGLLADQQGIEPPPAICRATRTPKLEIIAARQHWITLASWVFIHRDWWISCNIGQRFWKSNLCQQCEGFQCVVAMLSFA